MIASPKWDSDRKVISIPTDIAPEDFKESLPVEDIRIDGGTQPRLKLNDEYVQELAEALKSGVTLPPVTVFYDGNNYWLADGFHRYNAHIEAGEPDIDVDMRSGTQRDAVLFSVGANAKHGLRRTNEDKRRAVLRLLGDSEWCRWSDREVARLCGVSAPLVGAIRKETLTVNSYSENSEGGDRTYTTKHGTVATMNTARIGKSEPSGLPSQRYDQGSEDTDPAEEWESTETRYYNTIPLFNRNDLTEPEESLRAKYSKADDNICPSWNELIPLFELVGQVMEGEAAAKLNLLPTGDRRRKLPAYIVHRPDLGSPFPLLLWTRENAWQYWQQRRDKLVGLAERKPMSNEFTDGFKTDVETPRAPLAIAPEPSEEMPREEHPAGVLASAASCEHYTPEWIWKAALEVFCVEEFDLDPSTHDDSPIPSKQRYTREDDGLSQQWEAGYLWSNFPYSDVHPGTGKKMQVMGLWVDKFLEEYNAGRTKQAMTLVKSDCRPEWFQALLGECTAFCMLAKAVSFDTPDGSGGSSFFGSVVFYFGEDVEQFHFVFSKFGHVCQVVDPENLGW